MASLASLADGVTRSCARALATHDVMPLHQARAALEHFVLGHRKRGDAARELEHERLRQIAPLQHLVELSFRALGSRG